MFFDLQTYSSNHVSRRLDTTSNELDPILRSFDSVERRSLQNFDNKADIRSLRNRSKNVFLGCSCKPRRHLNYR